MEYYYYNKTTGEFTQRHSKLYPFTDEPYINRPKFWNWSLYSVNLETLEPVLKT